jgi:predicted nucleic acid-binding protein
MSASPFGSGLPLVIDTSAWNRQAEPGILEAWETAVEEDLLVCCPAAALEILSGARDEREFKLLDDALGALPQAPVTASVCRAALGACRDLGARRRIPAADYLIAAAAADRGFGVVHADKHFELLAEVLGFESARVAVSD